MDVIDPVPFGGFSLGGVLAPLRVLSFWVMKQRALSFGETGAARLLGSLQEAASEARFHLVGLWVPNSSSTAVISSVARRWLSGVDRRPWRCDCGI